MSEQYAGFLFLFLLVESVVQAEGICCVQMSLCPEAGRFASQSRVVDTISSRWNCVSLAMLVGANMMNTSISVCWHIHSVSHVCVCETMHVRRVCAQACFTPSLQAHVPAHYIRCT